MVHNNQSSLQNRLLSRLPGDDFAVLAKSLTRVDFPHALTISKPNETIPCVVFPETVAISTLVLTPDGRSAETGLIGREGFAPPSVLLGTDRTPHLVDVQIAGSGHRIETADLLAAVAGSESLRTVLLRFAHTLGVQTACTAMSNAAHSIEERLARWLLMCHDRSPSDDLALTHRFMAVMLAVRRASVTTTLQSLEGHGFVRAERGYVTIRNRAALEDFAASAYGIPEGEYRRLLGPL